MKREPPVVDLARVREDVRAAEHRARLTALMRLAAPAVLLIVVLAVAAYVLFRMALATVVP